MSALVTAITTCRSCGSGSLDIGCDFGEVALNAFPLPGDSLDETAPITVCRCAQCGLVQLSATVQRDRLFRSYYYKSSIQPMMVSALKDVVEAAKAAVNFGPRDIVVSVGCNDGTELSFFPETANRIGFDPSRNLAGEAAQHCTTFYNDYFPSPSIVPQKAKIILSLACLYDVEDLGAWCEGIRSWLADDGVWVAQVSYLPATLQTRNVGDFVHEHTSYFTLAALNYLFCQHGLYLERYEFNRVNGGSVRLFVRTRWCPPQRFTDQIYRGDLEAFGERVRVNALELRDNLDMLRATKKTVIGLGASTKMNGVLSVYRIGPDLLPMFMDRDPRKNGRTTVTRIPIVSEEAGRDLQPDVMVVGIPQFLDGLKEREAPFLRGGGRFLLPFPTVDYVGL